MKFVLRAVVAIWLLVSALPVFASDPAMVNVAAYASYSAYQEDDNVKLTREELGKLGFSYESIRVGKYNVLLAKRASDHLYVLATAGTESKASLQLDLLRSFVPYLGDTERQVHEGFFQLSQSLRTDSRVDHFIQEVASNPQNKLLLTGHSLGGAVAIITAKSLDESHILPTSQLEVITFGAPMPGNRAFVECLQDLPSEYIAIDDDIVPRILQLVSDRYRGTLDNTIRWDSGKPYTIFAHSMQHYLEEAQKQAALAYEDDKHVPDVKKMWIAKPKLTNQARFSESFGLAFTRQIQHALLLQDQSARAVSYEDASVEEALRTARTHGYEELLYITLRAKTMPTSTKQQYTMQAESIVYDVKTGATLAYQDGVLEVDQFGTLITTGYRIADFQNDARLIPDGK